MAEILAFARERVGFVDEEDAVECLLALVERLHGRLADITCDQIGALHLDHMSFAQHLERAINLPQRARDLGLADAGRPGEHHVPAYFRHRQALLTALALDFDAGQAAC